MTVKRDNVHVILSEEDFNIFKGAYDILSMIIEEGRVAHKNDVDINVIDEENQEIRYSTIESAYCSLGNILWYRQ
jgi:hypothetical protein